ncbi:hypothetical protein, partial [Burkholderia sp. BCCCDS18]
PLGRPPPPPAKFSTAAPALRFAYFAPFCGEHAFSPRNDALPKVWESAQKMYLERRNWIDTLHSLHQRRQPRRSRIEPTPWGLSMTTRTKFAASLSSQSG